MGMTIENSIRLLEDYLEWQKLHEMDGNGVDEATRNLIDVAREYQKMQADYEKRLKADMVAMLEDLRLDFQEATLAGIIDKKELIFADEVDYLVQQKINALMERGNNGNNVR